MTTPVGPDGDDWTCPSAADRRRTLNSTETNGSLCIRTPRLQNRREFSHRQNTASRISAFERLNMRLSLQTAARASFAGSGLLVAYKYHPIHNGPSTMSGL